MLVVFAIITNGTLFRPRNITMVFTQFSYVLILAVGMVMIIIEGQIDISIGAGCAMLGAMSVYLYNTGCGMVVTVLGTIVMGIAVGAWNGFWVTAMRLPSFIVTMAGMWLFRGITYIITKVAPVQITGDKQRYIDFTRGSVSIPALTINKIHLLPIIIGIVIFICYTVYVFTQRNKIKRNGGQPDKLLAVIAKLAIVAVVVGFLAWSFASYRGVPVIIIVMGVISVMAQFMMTSTPLGRRIYAVGGNPNAARLAGISSNATIFTVFCIMGALMGVGAIVITGYMSTALPQAGLGYEMDAIAACYVGGVSASGGIGTVLGVIVGGLVMAVINNGMTIQNVDPGLQFVVRGVVIVLAVLWDVYSRRKAGLA
jgi:putative multiple sugar transport system permease protein